MVPVTIGTVRRRAPLVPAVSGIAGVVLAHAVAYVLAFPEPAARHAALQASGHGYWHHATDFGLIAAAFGLIMAVGRGLAPVARGRPGIRRALPGLVAWQICLFTCLEVAEGIAAGAPVSTMLAEPVFLIGLILQVAAATAVLFLLVGVERVVAAAVRVRRASPVLPARPDWLPAVFPALVNQCCSRPHSRGPPCPTV